VDLLRWTQLRCLRLFVGDWYGLEGLFDEASCLTGLTRLKLDVLCSHECSHEFVPDDSWKLLSLQQLQELELLTVGGDDGQLPPEVVWAAVQHLPNLRKFTSKAPGCSV
jgi:hypothetical protein